MTEVRTYRQKHEVSPEDVQKLQKSHAEVACLVMREINCPYCGFVVDRVFSDATGHRMIYCRKCKEEYPINLGYFRRIKQWRRDSGWRPKRKRQNR